MKSLSVRVQLMLMVNLTLGLLLAVLLVWEYRREMTEHVRDKQIALQDEAIAVHQAVAHLLQGHGVEDVQKYVDTVCASMRHSRSPGHHIVVEFNGQTVHAHQAESHELLKALKSGIRFPQIEQDSDSSDRKVTFRGKQLVVGSQTSEGVTVYVSEYLTNVRRAIRSEVLWQSAILAGLGLLATLIVNITLIKLVTRPLQSLSAIVTEIAEGNFGIQVAQFGNSELDDLAQAVNTMSKSLAESEQHRQKQMQRAREIQEHLLPHDIDIPGMKAVAFFHPAEEVAGDFYDVFPLADGTWLICVADVVGHGVPAAMGSAMLKMLVANAAEHHHDPAQILDFINRRFVDAAMPGYFASVFLARWHPSEMQLDYASAGHEPGLLFTDGHVIPLEATGMFVGIGHDLSWNMQSKQLHPGERLLLLTDGVVEATNQHNDLFGRQRTTQLFADHQVQPLEESLQEIQQTLADFQGTNSANDDMTLLIVEVAPSSTATTASRSEKSRLVDVEPVRNMS